MSASGRRRKRVNSTAKSAVSSASSPGIDPRWSGSIAPVAGSIENKTVQRNPWWTLRMRASCGSASSERYSSSPATSTTCLPAPGPSPPAYVSGACAISTCVARAAPTTSTTPAIVAAHSLETLCIELLRKYATPPPRPTKGAALDRPPHVARRDPREAREEDLGEEARHDRQRGKRPRREAPRGSRRRLHQHVLGRAAARERHGHHV